MDLIDLMGSDGSDGIWWDLIDLMGSDGIWWDLINLIDLVGGFNPSENQESQLGWLLTVYGPYGKIKHDPNRRPAMDVMDKGTNARVNIINWYHDSKVQHNSNWDTLAFGESVGNMGMKTFGAQFGDFPT